MIKATLWLTVHRGGSTPNFTRELWVKDVTYLPMPGDEVVLYGTSEEPTDGGPHVTQERRWWTLDGILHAQLASVVVDPVRDVDRGEHPWWSDTDGQPVDYLVPSGWRPYVGSEAVRG